MGRAFGRKEKVVRRYALPDVTPVRPPPATHKTEDQVVIRLDGLVMSVQRKIDLDLPFEVTVVVPRAEITDTYSEGRLVQRTRVYSSITIAHSPRFEGLRR